MHPRVLGSNDPRKTVIDQIALPDRKKQLEQRTEELSELNSALEDFQASSIAMLSRYEAEKNHAAEEREDLLDTRYTSFIATFKDRKDQELREIRLALGQEYEADAPDAQGGVRWVLTREMETIVTEPTSRESCPFSLTYYSFSPRCRFPNSYSISTINFKKKTISSCE